MLRPRSFSTVFAWIGKRVETLRITLTYIVFLAITLVVVLLDREALHISGIALGVSLGIASAAFSYARTLEAGALLRAEVVSCGESLLQSASYFLLTALFKYVVALGPKLTELLSKVLPKLADNNAPGHSLSLDFLNMIPWVTFFFGTLYFQSGFFRLTSISASRLTSISANRRQGYEIVANEKYKSELKTMADADQAAMQRPDGDPNDPV